MMKYEPLNDNSLVKDEIASTDIVKELENKNIYKLSRDNFIVFPQLLEDSYDLDEESYVFERKNDATWTTNVVGILSKNDDILKINSRFSDKQNHEDFFLRYMIQKVLNYNVINNNINESDKDEYYNLLVFLFPYYLNLAMSKGIYKEYVKREYNDANIKGPIDIGRQIRENIPFLGKVAYRTREFSFDNNINELIRHTIEKLQLEYEFVLSNDEVTKTNVKTIKQVTNDYRKEDLYKTIRNNITNPVKQGYFEDYAFLQQLCLRILAEENTGYGEDEQKVHGIIIDVAWLWEEYIGKITGWRRYGRRQDLHTMNLFIRPASSPRYPDFVKNNIPIDTKYKRQIDTRNDYNQITTYIHIMMAKTGGFLQPTNHQNESGIHKIGTLDGYGGDVFTYKFYIPQQVISYKEFADLMKQSENELKSQTL